MLAVKCNKVSNHPIKHDGSKIIFRNKDHLTANILGMKYDYTTDIVHVNGR